MARLFDPCKGRRQTSNGLLREFFAQRNEPPTPTATPACGPTQPLGPDDVTGRSAGERSGWPQ